jgi:hypothetical protein
MRPLSLIDLCAASRNLADTATCFMSSPQPRRKGRHWQNALRSNLLHTLIDMVRTPTADAGVGVECLYMDSLRTQVGIYSVRLLPSMHL